ncbi:MAG: hypothetical protein RL497_2090 [Pseudomonadota bacterium]|jgi:hypothetical protein
MIDNAIAKAIKMMSMTKSDAEKCELEKDAKSHNSIGSWKGSQIAKSSTVGFGTGLLGGPAGLALEAADLAYLIAQAGRGCYGVGHIYGKDIDYENDISLILAVWSGAADTAGTVAAGKIGIKIGGAVGLNLAGHAVGKVLGKVVAKSTIKAGGKVGALILAKASSKLASKLVGKVSFKWIPIVGGAVGAGINWWVMSGLINAADKFYSSEYLILSDELARNIDE